jgi:hypothetical protein
MTTEKSPYHRFNVGTRVQASRNIRGYGDSWVVETDATGTVVEPDDMERQSLLVAWDSGCKTYVGYQDLKPALTLTKINAMYVNAMYDVIKAARFMVGSHAGQNGTAGRCECGVCAALRAYDALVVLEAERL